MSAAHLLKAIDSVLKGGTFVPEPLAQPNDIRLTQRHSQVAGASSLRHRGFSTMHKKIPRTANRRGIYQTKAAEAGSA